MQGHKVDSRGIELALRLSAQTKRLLLSIREEEEICRAEKEQIEKEVVAKARENGLEYTNLAKEVVTFKDLINSVVSGLEADNRALTIQKDQLQEELLRTRAELSERKEEFGQVCASLSDDLRQAEFRLAREIEEKQVLERDNQRLAIELSTAQEEHRAVLKQHKATSLKAIELSDDAKSLDSVLRIIWQFSSHQGLVEELILIAEESFMPFLLSFIAEITKMQTITGDKLLVMPASVGILVNLAASESGRNAILSHSGSYDGKNSIQLLVGLVNAALKTKLGASFERLVLSLLNNVSFTKIGCVRLLNHGVLVELLSFMQSEAAENMKDYCLYIIHQMLKYISFSDYDCKPVIARLFKEGNNLKLDNMLLLYEDYLRLFGEE